MCLFLALLVAAAVIDESHRMRRVADRSQCASNLQQIGQAILAYHDADHPQRFPRTVLDMEGETKPVWGTPYEGNDKLGPIQGADPFAEGAAKPKANDVTAALFLILRDQSIKASAVVCPSTDQTPWDFGGEGHSAKDWTNWQGIGGLAAHLSYSYENPYGTRAAVNNGWQLQQPEDTYAIAADTNPGGSAVTTVTPDSPSDQMKKANSLNHAGEGQNVLYGDYHVAFASNPFCGTSHDNIYTAAGPEVKDEQARGTAVIGASPCSGTDSILLPTAADIGYKGPAK
jgi:hypothetical protein